MRIVLTAFVAAAGALWAQSGAYAVSITNGSFESGTDPGSFLTLSSPDTTDITGWTVSSGSIDYIGTYWTAANGQRSLDMNGLEPGSISQTLNGLSLGQQYTISFDLSGNPAGGPSLKLLVAGADESTGGPSQTYSYNISTQGNTLTNMHWMPESFTFTATGGSEDLTFTSSTTANSGNSTYPTAFGPALDNVSISATPLPAALPLFAGGIGVIGLLARRKKRKAQGAVAA